MNVFSPLNRIFQDAKIIDILNNMFSIFSNPAFFNTLVGNCVERANEMAIMIVTIPGAECYTIGFRVGALQRFLTGVKY